MHFRETWCGKGGEWKQCCGQDVEDVDWDEGMETMEDIYPWCYEGKHWEREITTDDEVDDEVDENGNPRQVVWWREWRQHGNGCGKKKCARRT